MPLNSIWRISERPKFDWLILLVIINCCQA